MASAQQQQKQPQQQQQPEAEQKKAVGAAAVNGGDNDDDGIAEIAVDLFGGVVVKENYVSAGGSSRSGSGEAAAKSPGIILVRR